MANNDEEINISSIFEDDVITLMYLSKEELNKVCDSLNISYSIFMKLNNRILKTSSYITKRQQAVRIINYINKIEVKDIIYSSNIICVDEHIDEHVIDVNSFVLYQSFNKKNKNWNRIMTKYFLNTDNPEEIGNFFNKTICWKARYCWEHNIKVTFKELMDMPFNEEQIEKEIKIISYSPSSVFFKNKNKEAKEFLIKNNITCL